MDTLEMMNNFGLTATLRDLQIAARARRGEHLREIADEFEMSLDDVLVVLERVGTEVSSLADNDSLSVTARSAPALSRHERDQQRMREVVNGWVKLHPGCTHQEIAAEFSLPLQHVKSHIRDVHGLVLTPGRRTDILPRADRQQWHLADACAALSVAATICSPLTREKYEELRRNGHFQGPSGAWICTRFPSWRDACASAGVTSGEPCRTVYTRKWTPDDLLAWVGRFLTETLKSSSSDYDAWAREIDGAPSGPTIRNTHTTWLNARMEALLMLRATWAE